jgi:hypothetical protein
MAALAWLVGTFAGLCMVMGIVTATGVVPLLGAELTWTFWFMLSAILFLASIALASGRGEY